MESDIQKIKDLIAKGKIVLAIKKSKSLIENIDFMEEEIHSELKRSILLISADFEKERKAILDGTINTEDQNKYQNLRNDRLIRTLDQLMIEYKESKSSHTKYSHQGATAFLFWNNNYSNSQSPFQKNYQNRFQEFFVFQDTVPKNKSQVLIDEIANHLLGRVDNETQLWAEEGDSNMFDKIYTNTNVMYFLIQFGFNLSHSKCQNVLSFLDQQTEISVDNRAKFYFDIQTGRIKNSIAIQFLDLLSKHQNKDDSQFSGGFIPFRQGAVENDDSPNRIPTHYGGMTFHACLIADVLLHLKTDNHLLKDKAINILKGIQLFLSRMSNDNRGYLIDGNFNKSPQFTTWFYAISFGLGIPLPLNWQSNLQDIISIKESSMFKLSLTVMNIALLVIRCRFLLTENLFKLIRSYFEQYFDELEMKLEAIDEISCRDLALFGRSLMYINKSLGNATSKI